MIDSGRNCSSRIRLLTFLFIGMTVCAVQAQPFKDPPGRYRTSWVGNSFGGDGGPNGLGYWVQNGADEIEVTPDGTVMAGTDWDEAGGCVGLYKDGKCNRVLLKKEGGKETAWGWNTGNHAIAAYGEQIFVANTGKRLLRFRWKPGNLDSARFCDEVEMPDKAVALNSRGEMLVVGYAGRIELRGASDMSVASGFDLPEVRDLTVAPDQSLWIIVVTKILHLGKDGKESGPAVNSVAKPTAIAFDSQNRLIVCDDGPSACLAACPGDARQRSGRSDVMERQGRVIRPEAGPAAAWRREREAGR